MRNLAIILVILALPGLALAQTVTVHATGGGMFTTITSAEASFTPDPNPALANVIQILDSAVYNERVILNVPVTLQGMNTGVNRPVIAAIISASIGGAEANDGLTVIGTTTGETTNLQNLIIIPSLVTPPTDDLLRAFTAVGTVDYNVNLTDVLITANNGSNVPVTFDGLSAVSLVGATQTGDDGAFLSGAADYTLTNVVISHANQVAGDGLVCSSTTLGDGAISYDINDGCVFSFMGRLGIQANGIFTINAPTTRCMVLGNRGFAGVWGAGSEGPRNWNGLNVLNTVHPTIPAQGWGIESQNNAGFAFNLSNCIIAGNQAQGLLVGSATTNVSAEVTDTTIASNFTAIQIDAAAAAPGHLNLTDCIIAGNASPEAENRVRNLSTLGYVVNIDHCGLVTNGGPHTLFPPGTEGPGAVNVTNSIPNRPGFIETVNYLSASFYDVDHPIYGTAATGGTPLGGGADFIGSLPSELGVFSTN